MRKKEKKFNYKIIYLIIILIFLIITSFIFAKYAFNDSKETGAKIAVMANDVYLDIDGDISGYPGCAPIIYPIKLTNKDGDKICDVSQKYKILVESTEKQNIPISVSLYKDKECTQGIIKDETGAFSDDDFLLLSGIEQEQMVYLKIDWPKESNDSNLAFEIDYLRIHIISTQVQPD